MSKRGYISRYLLILKKVKPKSYPSYEEIRAYIEKNHDYLQMLDEDLQIGFSKRTFQRDLKEIRNVFGIDIEYSKAKAGYFISNDEGETMNFQRMMEAFDLFNSLNVAHDLSPYIHLEKRRPQGTENLYGLLHAIKNRFIIQFDYQKFWDENPKKRTVKPYALKEFKNRWYVMAQEEHDSQIKSFSLDRISQMEISNQKFHFSENYDVEQSYRYCFGIINPSTETPQDIILSFTAHQGKYIKTLPLHESQEILIDNPNEVRIKLKLYVTHDLVMELLSHGANMKVIEPQSLADHIKQAHAKAMARY